MSHRQSWTEEEDRIIKAKWGQRPLEEISKELLRTVEAVRHRAGLLGLRCPHGCIVNRDKDEEYMQKVRAELGTVGEADE